MPTYRPIPTAGRGVALSCLVALGVAQATLAQEPERGDQVNAGELMIVVRHAPESVRLTDSLVSALLRSHANEHPEITMLAAGSEEAEQPPGVYVGTIYAGFAATDRETATKTMREAARGLARSLAEKLDERELRDLRDRLEPIKVAVSQTEERLDELGRAIARAEPALMAKSKLDELDVAILSETAAQGLRETQMEEVRQRSVATLDRRRRTEAKIDDWRQQLAGLQKALEKGGPAGREASASVDKIVAQLRDAERQLAASEDSAKTLIARGAAVAQQIQEAEVELRRLKQSADALRDRVKQMPEPGAESRLRRERELLQLELQQLRQQRQAIRQRGSDRRRVELEVWGAPELEFHEG